MKGYWKGIVFISLLLGLAGRVQATDPLNAELDQLFAGRDEIQNLQKADMLLSADLGKQPSPYESLWRAGRIKYYLAGMQKEKPQKSRLFEEGMNLSRHAVEVEPSRPEGHFWLAANCGEYASLRGVWASLRLLSTIRQEFEKVLEINPGFDQARAYLALGEMKLRLPYLLGGDDAKGIQYLQEGLRLAPGNHELKISLAAAYLQNHREAEARWLLEQVLRLVDPTMTPHELSDVRQQAQQKLSTLERRR